MCGIAGIVPSRDLDPAQLERWVRRMCESMVHRGPDDEGVFIAPDIGLGVRRLAIIDIKNGRQPMYSSDGRHTIVFNGEIYNFVALEMSCSEGAATSPRIAIPRWCCGYSKSRAFMASSAWKACLASLFGTNLKSA